MSMTATRTSTHYEPPGLREVVDSITYLPGWAFRLEYEVEDDGSGGLQLIITSCTRDSMNHDRKIYVGHPFLVPAASYKPDVWKAWIRDRLADVWNHEIGEELRFDGVREFAPHHSKGENPYIVWHMSDYATANKSQSDD